MSASPFCLTDAILYSVLCYHSIMIDNEKLCDLRQRASRVKLFATDLDGTLHDGRHMLSQENREALLALSDKGIILVCATGRSRSSIPAAITDIDCIKYLITANGARIHLNGTDEIISEKFLEFSALEYIRPFFDDDEVMCEVFWDGVPHVEEKRYHDARDYGVPRWFSDYFFKSRIPLKDFEKEAFDNAGIIENINFVFGKESAQNRILSFLKERTDLYELTSSFPFNYEIGGIGVSKGAALDLISKREGVLPEEIIAFGDNENDVTMIEYAGIGVAVANAVPRAIEAADLVTEHDNNNSAVAEALKLLQLID